MTLCPCVVACMVPSADSLLLQPPWALCSFGIWHAKRKLESANRTEKAEVCTQVVGITRECCCQAVPFFNVSSMHFLLAGAFSRGKSVSTSSAGLLGAFSKNALKWAKCLLFLRAVLRDGQLMCSWSEQSSPVQGVESGGGECSSVGLSGFGAHVQMGSARRREAVQHRTRELPSALLTLAWLLYKYKFTECTDSYHFFFFPPPSKFRLCLSRLSKYSNSRACCRVCFSCRI